ncbi:MAG: HAMP domain-containing histidine kinase [Betaproteobacteria bacterium]|nr:HAMP domain-containing histidine kinase [Betaproteobacteria bacterium]
MAFRVADDGPGIAPEDRERAFQMFETLGPKSEQRGSGIGLALVRRLVTQAGGHIQIVEGVGTRGVTFEFTWPIHWQKEGVVHATTILSSHPTGSHDVSTGQFDGIHASVPHPAG